MRTGDDIIDAVIVDEEAVGVHGKGTGARILYGKGAFDLYLARSKMKDQEVCLKYPLLSIKNLQVL